MPLTKEFRLFFLDHSPVYWAEYWEEGNYDGIQPPIDQFQEIAKRIQSRFAETPHQTWAMSDEELTTWRAFFQEPDEAELDGSVLEDAPQEFASWSAWAANRWPSLPDEYA